VQAGRWRADADAVDRRVLAHCHGPTIDLGCGPGRMAAHLRQQGVPVLAVDNHPEAVAQTRARGVPVVQRDVFTPLPAEGRWPCALLVDGNIGIGGDPVRLLRRVARLIEPSGTVLVETAPPGAGLRIRTPHLRTSSRRSHPFPWAVVGADALPRVAARAGLCVIELLRYDDRHFGVLGHIGREAPCPV
jgi:SAM-dependent methyltransferase